MTTKDDILDYIRRVKEGCEGQTKASIYCWSFADYHVAVTHMLELPWKFRVKIMYVPLELIMSKRGDDPEELADNVYEDLVERIQAIVN